MRITNKMMTNNMMSNINKNKNSLNKYDSQYTSGKKIQRPSDDPIVAVRSLKLRSTISELNQYLEKNIPDALSWMEVTEGALKNINSVMTKINTYCNQGANDPLSVSDRNTIVENLMQYKEQIYKECNSNYAGRYVFAGFKTNNSVTYETAQQDKKYEITQSFGGQDIEQFSKVVGGYTTADYDSEFPDADDFAQAPQLKENLYRIRLAYDNLDDVTMTSNDIMYAEPVDPNDPSLGVTMVPITSLGVNVENRVSTDENAYIPEEGQIIFLKDTGELIMGAGIYEKLRLQKNGGISVQYQKTNFSVGDCKPEHFFNCKVTDSIGEVKEYVQSEQSIYYEINFSQTMKVNTQISTVMDTSIARDIDEILDAVNAVADVEEQIKNVESLLSNVDITPDQEDALNALKGQLSTELVLKTKIMTNAFESGIGKSEKYQSDLNIAIADLGSRYMRLELTQSRLETQQIDYTELLSNNEDADLVESFINLSAAETIYNASLNSVSKIMANSLLDFI